MYSEEEFDKLEQEEHNLTVAALIAIFLLLRVTKKKLEKELAQFYQQYGTDGVVTIQEARKWANKKDHRQRLTVLLLFLFGEFNSFRTKATPKFSSFLTDIVEKETKFFGVDLDTDDILKTAWGVDDLDWVTRFDNDIDLWNSKLAVDIKQSIMRQDNIEDVLELLDKRFVSIEKVLNRLALTESTAIGSIARKEIFKELGIKKYKFYAREDERTCETCGSLHGLIFPVSEYEIGITASPIHSHCRCWEVPIRE